MSKKSAKIASLLANLPREKVSSFDPHYLGYFECFNQQLYYEAHDVLEELWLETKGENHLFYKGLIQLTGAFVHLKKSNLDPAARLFRLALKNLAPYSPVTENLDVEEIISRIRKWLEQLERSNHTENPYHPENPPSLNLTTGHS